MSRVAGPIHEAEFAEAIFSQMEGFGEYGFPESHAASFALLAYASSWLKCHYPQAFLAALLNSQPMGFYRPAQLVQDAERSGVRVLPVDVCVSHWDATLEPLSPAEKKCARNAPPPDPEERQSKASGRASQAASCHNGASWAAPCSSKPSQPRSILAISQNKNGVLHSRLKPDGIHAEQKSSPHSSPHIDAAALGRELEAGSPESGGSSQCEDPKQLRSLGVRLGMNLVKGLSRAAGLRIEAARAQRPFASLEDLAYRAQLNRDDLQALAAADAYRQLTGHRRQAAWAAAVASPQGDLLQEAPMAEEAPRLAAPAEAQDIVADYRSLGLTLHRHPLALLRSELTRRRFMTAQALHDLPNGRLARACGIVVGRQRPGTAKGTIFVTLEDETGPVNVIVWPGLVEQQRRELLGAQLMGVYGEWQSSQNVYHLVARRLVDLSDLLGSLSTRSRDFH